MKVTFFHSLVMLVIILLAFPAYPTTRKLLFTKRLSNLPLEEEEEEEEERSGTIITG